MTMKNEFPVYTESAKELKAEINTRIAEVMRENVADSSYRVAPIKPIDINGVEYNGIALSKDDRGIPYTYLRSDSNSENNLLRTDKLPDSTSLLKKILQKINDSYYNINGTAVKAKPDLHNFQEGEYLQFRTKSGKGTDLDIRGHIEKVGNAWSVSHLFGSPAIKVKGENFFIDDIKEDSLLTSSIVNAIPSDKLDIDKINKELSSFAIKDFDIKCDVYAVGNGGHYDIDTIHIRNRQLDSVSGDYHGYEYDDREVAVPVERGFSDTISHISTIINKEDKKAIMCAVASTLPYLRTWADEVAKQHDQEKADRVTARLGKLVALMPDPGDKMTFKKPMALDDYISIDGIGDMEITEIKNAGDGRFTVSDGERVIPFGRMMEWDQDIVVTMCEQLDRENRQEESYIYKDTVAENYRERAFTEDEAMKFMKNMEASAVPDPQVSLTPETWIQTFGLNNSLQTPIGNVKMGEGQYQKFFDKARSQEFGMAVGTLKDPDTIMVEPSHAIEGQKTERPYSYIFVKTFDRNGEKTKYYASVTVQRDNMEVSVSSHYMKEKRVLERLMELERIYSKEALLPISSERHLAEQRDAVPDLLPTQGNNATSVGKGTENSGNKQENSEKKSDIGETIGSAKSLIMAVAAQEIRLLSYGEKNEVTWDDIKEKLTPEQIEMIDDLDKHIMEKAARADLYRELDNMATRGDTIKVPLTYVGIGPESGINFTEIRYLEDYKDYAGVGTDGHWLSMKNIPADQVALVHNKLLIAQLADMIGEGNTVKLQNPVTVNVAKSRNVDIDSVRITFVGDEDIELVANGKHERDGKTFEDELIDSDLVHSVNTEDLKEIVEAVRTMKESWQQEAGKYNSQAYAALQEKAVSLFGKDAHLELADYKSVIRVGVGDMPDTITINTIDIKDGKMTLSSDDIGGEIDEKMLDGVYIENISAMLDELHTAYQQPMEKHTGMSEAEEKMLSDADIARQYSDYKVTGIKFYEQTQPDAFSGVVDLEFPNADHPDYDSSMSNPFISYDNDGKQIAFDRWMPEEVYKGVSDAIREERPKHLIHEAIVSRILEPSPSATFTKEQQDVIISYLKDYPSVDRKLQALSPLWQEAEKDARVKGEPSEWFTPVKEELNDLASGIRREPDSQGLKL